MTLYRIPLSISPSSPNPYTTSTPRIPSARLSTIAYVGRTRISFPSIVCVDINVNLNSPIAESLTPKSSVTSKLIFSRPTLNSPDCSPFQTIHGHASSSRSMGSRSRSRRHAILLACTGFSEGCFEEDPSGESALSTSCSEVWLIAHASASAFPSTIVHPPIHYTRFNSGSDTRSRHTSPVSPTG